MGNHKFRLSNMIPNAWFCKLKDMSTKPRNGNGNGKASIESLQRRKPSRETTTRRVSQKTSFSQPRFYSYNFSTESQRSDHKLFCNSPINPKVLDTHFPELTRISSMKKSNRKSIYSPSPRRVVSLSSVSVSSPRCSCRATFNSFSCTHSSTESEFFHECPLPEFERPSSLCGYCKCRVSSSTTDIILDMIDNNSSFSTKFEKFDDFDTTSELEPPPKFNFTTTTTKKVTKTRTSSSSKLEESGVSIKIVQKEQSPNPVFARNSSTRGVKLRKTMPKLARKGTSSSTKSKRLTESFAIVKNSNDPERDFKDSMMEMIVENNIRASKDLEELLACYLLLNSNEYHDLIVKAFEHIWFDMA